MESVSDIAKSHIQGTKSDSERKGCCCSCQNPNWKRQDWPAHAYFTNYHHHSDERYKHTKVNKGHSYGAQWNYQSRKEDLGDEIRICDERVRGF